MLNRLASLKFTSRFEYFCCSFKTGINKANEREKKSKKRDSLMVCYFFVVFGTERGSKDSKKNWNWNNVALL